MNAKQKMYMQGLAQQSRKLKPLRYTHADQFSYEDYASGFQDAMRLAETTLAKHHWQVAKGDQCASTISKEALSKWLNPVQTEHYT